MKHLLSKIAIGLFVLLLFVFMGCSKEKGKYHTVIYGKLVDFHTRVPIQNARVVLADGRIITDSFFGGGDEKKQLEKVVDSTDENGQFFLELVDHYNVPIFVSYAENYYEGDYTTSGYRLYDSYIDPGIYTDLILCKKGASYDDK